MAFQVELSAHAAQDIEEHYVWIQERNPAAAEKWFNGIMAAIHTLKDFPQRCPKIPSRRKYGISSIKNTVLFLRFKIP